MSSTQEKVASSQRCQSRMAHTGKKTHDQSLKISIASSVRHNPGTHPIAEANLSSHTICMEDFVCLMARKVTETWVCRWMDGRMEA
mmetsp:Transcript_34998/g.58570  ORF Transcript_34998/g.58570 Transcript_34998/m.58570 type:complete len:86 (+) Transcript_34998:508-765(+)